MSIASLPELVARLEAANKAYRAGAPTMSDSDYDQLEEALRLIDPNHPLLQSLHDDEFGVEQPLTIAMGSQQKALNLGELRPFYDNTQQDELFWSEKLDGASLELTYVDSRFVQALTRGDGVKGVNVTAVAEHVASIPKTIPAGGTIVVRGEMMLRKSALAALNVERTAKGLDPYANVRNGAVSLMKTLANRPYAHYLSFKAFDVVTVKEA